MHDQTYTRELLISNAENGYRDIIAKPDLDSFRRIPWENDVPFFLISFYDPDTGDSLSACPRSLLARTVDKIHRQKIGAMAGGEQDSGLMSSFQTMLWGVTHILRAQADLITSQPNMNSSNSKPPNPTTTAPKTATHLPQQDT